MPNRMHPLYWVPSVGIDSLLDVGCNAGDLLRDLANQRPGLKLAGVDVNENAIQTARQAVPNADIRQASGHELPFASSSFDYATFIEVIEHIPAEYRRPALEEIHRVLRPGAKLLLRCPHAGYFDWLDSNNLRFRFPSLYRTLVKSGMRDKGYAGGAADVVWHYHFREEELRALTDGLFAIKNRAFGGLVVFPVIDILRWPFYRKNLLGHPALNLLEKIADWDMGLNFGRASFTILLELEKV